MHRQVFAKTALFNQDGLVLLAKRSATDDRRPNEWDLPGGLVENGEEINRGAAREVLEEVGLSVEPHALDLIFAETGVYKQDSNTRLLFVAHAPSGEITLSDEHSEYRWATLEQVIADFPHPVYQRGLTFARENGLLDAYLG